MATSKKASITGVKRSKLSWKHFFITASVVANIAFVVAVITMITSNALDGMFMNEGLKRYCLAANDRKFSDNSDYAKALRHYTCARGDAETYFYDGFNTYLDYKNIQRPTE